MNFSSHSSETALALRCFIDDRQELGKTKKGKLGAAKLPPVASASSPYFARAGIIWEQTQ